MENFATDWNWNREIEQDDAAHIASGDSKKIVDCDRDSAKRSNTWLNLFISNSPSLEFDAQSCPTYFLM